MSNGIDLNAWAKGLVERLDEKVKHVHVVVEQKLEYQQKYLEQRLENINQVQAEKLLNFSVRLEEAIAEIRGYKDILQQQLTLLDNSVKKSHARTDEVSKESETRSVEVEKTIEMISTRIHDTELKLTELQGEVATILKNELIEETKKEAKAEDPYRKFISENGKKVIMFLLAGIGLYLLRNANGLLAFFQSGP